MAQPVPVLSLTSHRRPRSGLQRSRGWSRRQGTATPSSGARRSRRKVAAKLKPRQPLYPGSSGDTDAWIRKLLRQGVLSKGLLDKADKERRLALRRARRGLSETAEEAVFAQSDDEGADDSDGAGRDAFLDQGRVDTAVRKVPERVLFSRSMRFFPQNSLDASISNLSATPSPAQYRYGSHKHLAPH